MTMTEEELEEIIDGNSEYTDGIDPTNAVMIVCDGLDLDPVRTLAKIRMNVRLTEQEYIIEDLLVCSQSNYKRSLHMIHRAVAAHELISRLEDNDLERPCTCGHPDCGAC